MRIIMAVSSDGFLCRGPDDDMSWTGPTDKLLFRALTGVGGVCAAGAKTWDMMPGTRGRPAMNGRRLARLSRSGYTLQEFHYRYPHGWLIGGPTVAKAAIAQGMVDEVHLCWITHARLADGVRLGPTSLLDCFRLAMRTDFGDVALEVYRP